MSDPRYCEVKGTFCYCHDYGKRCEDEDDGKDPNPQTSYEPLTKEQIEGFRVVLKNWTSRDSGIVQDRWNTLCDMAVNCLLYGEEIQRLRHDMERGMANHNADLNANNAGTKGDSRYPNSPVRREGEIPAPATHDSSKEMQKLASRLLEIAESNSDLYQNERMWLREAAAVLEAYGATRKDAKDIVTGGDGLGW